MRYVPVLFLVAVVLARGEEPPPVTGLHADLIGHWTDKSAPVNKPVDYYFTHNKLVITTQIKNSELAFCDYTVWTEWPDKYTLIINVQNENRTVKWVIKFSPDHKTATVRVRDKEGLADPFTLVRVDEKTQP
ncbi:MAG: hypothetical protein NTW87_20095 [Planctomycetota bacterium]|nr:hypothetical protein [Planctomycetota bacterium]